MQFDSFLFEFDSKLNQSDPQLKFIGMYYENNELEGPVTTTRSSIVNKIH